MRGLLHRWFAHLREVSTRRQQFFYAQSGVSGGAEGEEAAAVAAGHRGAEGQSVHLTESEEVVDVEKVSVYCTAYDCRRTLKDSVEAIRSSSYRLRELITVYDGGPGEVWPMAEALGIRVCREHNENKGLAASCNTALRNCEGDFLAKVDSDVELAPFWLARAMPHFLDDRIAGVGGRMVEGFANTLPMRWRARFMPQHWGNELSYDPPFLFGADCIFRVSALKKVGGWDEKYRTNYEDVDLCQRLKTAGFLVVYEPKCLARHRRHDSVGLVVENFWRWHKDAVDNAGGFASMENAGKAITWNVRTTAEHFKALMNEGAYDLVYPSLLLFFTRCIQDLAYLVKRGAVPSEVGSATAFHVLLEASRVAKRLPEEVGERLIEDMPIVSKSDDWEPDTAYMDAFKAATADLEVGPATRWALETSVAALEDSEE
jgi:glycosyltransferase involved in cell wall biosynthesis